MKKTILTFVLLIAVFATVHAQQTVIVKQNGILTDAATALVGVPVAAATGLIEGTANAISTIVSGRTTVVQGVIPAAPVITNFPTFNYVPPAPPARGVVVAPVQQQTIIVNGPAVVRGRSAYEHGIVPATAGGTVVISGGTVVAPATPLGVVPNPYVRPHTGRPVIVYP